MRNRSVIHHPAFLVSCVLLSVALLDQLTKFLITRTMHLGESIPVITGMLHLTLVHNSGSAFGLLKGANVFLIIVSFAVLFGVFYSLNNVRKQDKLMIFLLGVLGGGALGNLIDRLAFGYVVDFLDFLVWPVFNLADSALTISICGLAIMLWKKG